MHGGVKFYRVAPKAARQYVERDCARYDDYYLAEGLGIAMRFVATPVSEEHGGETGADDDRHPRHDRPRSIPCSRRGSPHRQ